MSGHKIIDVCGFPIDGEMGLKKWGEHMDVRYEISNHGRNKRHYRGDEVIEEAGPGTWCYYVAVEEGMLDPADFEKFWLQPCAERRRPDQPSYDYMSAAFACVHWHGGITYYEKRGGLDGAQRIVKMGCDFAHYWDDGRDYDFASVEFEAKKTIDELRDMFVFKRRCVYSGKWYPADQMTEVKGRLLGPERVEQMAAERATKGDQP